MLNLDFDYGIEIIHEIIEQKRENELKEIYFFAVPNGINNKHKTYEKFKNSVINTASSTIPEQELTVEEIMAKTKNTLDSFAEEWS